MSTRVEVFISINQHARVDYSYHETPCKALGQDFILRFSFPPDKGRKRDKKAGSSNMRGPLITIGANKSGEFSISSE